MKANPKSLSMEQSLFRLLVSRAFLLSFFFASFLGLGGLIGGSLLCRGLWVMACPLLAWSPFLLIISLHSAAETIRKVRAGQADRLWLLMPAAGFFLTFYIVQGAVGFLLDPAAYGGGVS